MAGQYVSVDEIPERTKWAIRHPIWTGLLSGAVLFVVTYSYGWWLSVCIAIGAFTGLLNWFLWFRYGPLRRRFDPALQTTYGDRSTHTTHAADPLTQHSARPDDRRSSPVDRWLNTPRHEQNE